MLMAGLLVGLSSYAIREFLGVRLGDELVVASLSDAAAGADRAEGVPRLAGFLVYFAGLFAAVRWWLQGDPLRTARLSLWATACCLLWAWIVHLFWYFPQPWGLMLAVSISAAVQLSAPWMSLPERSRIRRQAMEA
jgi:hypothetical protein